ncbi:predicted acyl-CoA transferase/carnitine dehydratase [Clostridium sp. SY8519]|uniref:CaiB/BaiF CoA transferase family protein n=1 Tax=Clostridium sp. (strain SY8519) TaxID=1042156 RepID=UPI0002171B75|nr:CaiB/BaiF CoA-transferase family protein [Clostridium sp. SY8519]BAK47593.1 predicted acyl-CoA transferase/carnitine dehydratase [Clostridium sp. SY8519]
MNKRLPLDGLKVVELATVVATPITGRLLSDYGAEVIKVEALAGDLLRPTGMWHQLPVEDDHNPLFDLCNTGKRLVALNLKSKEGMGAFIKLLERADIFLSNVRMQSLERMGIDYESIKDRFPGLIYAHFSGFGLNGPEKNKPGYDSTAFWMRTGGSTDISTPGAFPLRPSFAFGDIATASEFLAAILMAVIGRNQTGEGTMVATSLLQSGIWCNAVAVMNAQPQYGKDYPVERFLPGHPLADYYECKDGEYIAIMQNDYQKDRKLFADLFGLQELLDDPDLDTLTSMHKSGKVPALTHRMQDVMLQKTASEWDEILNENDIPHELAHHFRNTWQDPQARAVGAFDEVNYPEDVVTAIPRPPFDFSGYGRKNFQKTGGIGADTREVLEELGYSDEQIRIIEQA